MSGPAAAIGPRLRAARRDPSLVVLEGFHALKHALRFGAAIEAVYAEDGDRLAGLAADLAPDLRDRLDGLVTPAAPADLQAGDAAPPPTGVIAIARRPSADPSPLLRASATARPVVLLEEPRHLGNVGAVVRVAAAAGAGGVLTTGPADPWHPAALRGAAGLHFALPVARLDAGTDIPPERLVALDPEGRQLAPGLVPDGAVLAFGTERAGLSSGLLARAAHRIRIPMEPGVSSLNLATAVAVTLYAWRLARSDA
ncbi:TrmH family RNA methyltransferase [Marinivivus vitaminiproducens]|uniref:TrmH family RNA methyltransferase n=1 Tax=Marinivivus vitaminiproducens TaxID=3035935 RepID=UPI00279AFF0C|nr:TrmH family RNA methyltransferase [Geminicoccaceae bacterium SCSIO 64248]